MPINRRLPKKGFSNARFRRNYAIINVSQLAKLEVTGRIDETALRAAGLVSGRIDGIKLLGNGELDQKVEVEVDKVSASAREKVEKAGGVVVLRQMSETAGNASETEAASAEETSGEQA